MNDIKLTITKGKTFSVKLLWMSSKRIYRPITGISNTAPVRITCPSHGVPDGWLVAIESVKGMTEINATSNPPKSRDYVTATVIDTDTLEINSINAADFGTYTGGGYVQYFEPVDLTGYTARMFVKTKVGGEILLSLTTENGKISIDDVSKTVTLKLSASETEALTWKKGVYDLELVSFSGEVTAPLYGSITVVDEVTV